MPLDQTTYKQKTKPDVYPKVREYADRLEKMPPEHRLYMGTWYSEKPERMGDFWEEYYGVGCKTAACIAGWVCAWEKDLPTEIEFSGDCIMANPYIEKAREHMGLPLEQARTLFLGFDCSRPYSKEAVAKVMRHLAETGEVDWTKANS